MPRFQGVRGRPRSTASALSVTLAGLAAVVLLQRLPSAFLPTQSGCSAAAPARREFLTAAAISLALAGPQAGALPAYAADEKPAPKAAPEELEVSGVVGGREALNGDFVIVPGQVLNSRPVYKRTDQEIYLLYNDCDQFQFSDKIDSLCTGFAKETKVKGEVKWTVDGTLYGGIKIKPKKKVVPQAAEAKPVTAAPAGDDEDTESTSFALKIPKLFFNGDEPDMELLTAGDNVGNFIKAKSKMGKSFLEGAMEMEGQEAVTALSLEERLNGKFKPEVAMKGMRR